MRPGRFDRILSLNLPTANGRAAILNHLLIRIKNVLDKSFNVTELAIKTIGFSGADLV